MRKTTFLLICFIGFVIGNQHVFSQNNKGCNAELSVEKNRSIKSAGEKSAFFTLILKNTSSSTKTFNISAGNTTYSCKKNNYNVTKGSNINPELNVSIQWPKDIVSKTNDNSITLSGGVTQKFYLKVEVPDGTPFYTWSCLKVNAKSEDCSSDGAETILSVYIPNPSEE